MKAPLIRLIRAAVRWWLGEDTLSAPNVPRAVLLCSLATGFTGLAYETIFHRYLTALLGSNMRAAALLTGGFLASMSLGCAVAGRLTRGKPVDAVRLYGWAEIALGAWALAFPLLYYATSGLPGLFSRFGLFVDLALTALLVAPPAALMGATIPVLTHILSSQTRHTARRHSLLYGLNTVGAFAGIIIAGFYLIDLFGLRGTLWLLAPVNLVIGVFFLHWKEFAPSWSAPDSVEAPRAENAPPINRTLLLAAIGLSSFSFLAIENWILRIAGIAMEGSALTFVIVVGAFVLTTGIGALLTSLKERTSPAVLPWVLAVSTAGWMLVYLTAEHWPYLVYSLDFRAVNQALGPIEIQFQRLAALSLLLLLPAAPAGAFLPLCFMTLKEDAENGAGEISGAVYAASAFGLAAGAAFGGYWFFHWADLSGAFQAALAAQIAAILLSAAASSPSLMRPRFAGAAVGAAVLSVGLLLLPKLAASSMALSYYHLPFPEKNVPPENTAREGLYAAYGIDRVRSFATGPEASVAVLEGGDASGDRSLILTINGRSNSTTGAVDRPHNALSALIPYLLSSAPERALVVGFGTGVTAGSLGLMPGVAQVDVLEKSREVIRRAPDFDFSSYDASKNPKIRIIETDAVRHLQTEGPRYGIIVSVPANLWVAGVENLYSKEFYAAVKEKLEPGGVFLQWIPDYSFSNETLATVARSFETALPDATLWRLTKDHLAIVYYRGDGRFQNLERIEARSSQKQYRSGLASIGIKDPLLPLFFQIASPDMTSRIADWGALHSVHSPRIGRMATVALLARGEDGRSVPFIREVAPLSAHSPREFFVQRYQERFGDFSTERLVGIASETCTRLPRESAPCRYLALALPKESRELIPGKIFKLLIPHHRHAALLEALQIHNPEKRAARLDALQMRNEELLNILREYQNPIRPFAAPDSTRETP